jgi:predicted ArsR family transcriptional regulator
LKHLSIPAPGAVRTAAEYAVNASVREAFEKEKIELESIEMILNSARLEGVALDAEGLEMAVRRKTERMAEAVAAQTESLTLLQKLDSVVSLVKRLPFEVNLRKVQNTYYGLLQNVYPVFQGRAKKEKKARNWMKVFRSLGEKLMFRVA